MTYRSADGVLAERLEELEREVAALDARAQEVTRACEAGEARVRELAARLRVSGPGGAARGPTFDRIGVLVAGLCIVALLVVPAEIYIGGYVRRQPEETVLPILLLAGPGLLAALVAWPYRRVVGYGKGVLLGLGLALLAVVNVAVGLVR